MSYTVEYFKTKEKNGSLSFVTAWIKVKITVSREMSQAPRDKYYTISLICRICKS